MTPPKDGVHPPTGAEIRRIRQELDKRTAAEVQAAERLAANAAAADSAIRSGGDETDRVGLFKTIFGRKS